MPLKRDAALRKDRTNTSCQMQHRHFATIAAIISDLPAHIRTEVATEFAYRLQSTNANFNHKRFLTACLNVTLVQ